MHHANDKAAPGVALVIPLALGLLGGSLALQAQSQLPPPALALGFLALGLALGLAAWLARQRVVWPAVLVFCAAFVLAFATAALRAHPRLADRLAPALEGQDLRLRGTVIEMPRRTDHGLAFAFETLAPPQGVPGRLQLAWYRSKAAAVPDLRAGDRWALTVRLKRPHGSLNPHGSDREAQLLAQGIGATGYVRDPAGAERLADGAWAPMLALEGLRQRLRERFERALPDSPWRAVLVALAIGDQSGVSAAQWTLFSRSGITHLVSISGLHVTVWALLAGAVLGGLWRRIPSLVLRAPAQSVAALGGIVAAAAYVAIAGAATPAMRSLIMLAVAALATRGGRSIRPAQALAAALAAVLIFDPWCVLSKGTWLSFAAVAVLLWAAAASHHRQPAWRRWLTAQWAIGLGMLPLLLALTGQVSVVAPLANLVAVPVVTFVLLPIEFAFVVSDWAPLAHLAAAIFELLAEGLSWVSAPDWAIWQQAAVPPALIVLASAGALWALAPRGVPGRLAAIALVLVLLGWRPARPPEGVFDLVMLDVGQGLAVHLRTARHDMLFDAGPSFGASADAGQRIVVPYLRGEGVARLNGLVLSHADTDHTGGAASVLGALGSRWLMGSLPSTYAFPEHAPKPLRRCERGERWVWDGVAFEVLHPPAGQAQGGNRDSCVIRVEAGGHAALLAADIEVASERDLLAAGRLPRTDIVIAPHHGSRSSSSPEFIAALAPQWVLFPVGYRSRFGHPHADVLAAYRNAGATDLRSDRDGAVRLRVSASGIEVERWRERAHRYWHAEPTPAQ
ncbi:DNA internalization-related competence protein ComEC/Rec2 [Niveibacterium sp. 24ML]|uniref:DNA internalization-related competence protein ComEC/Rec2 n=1 Tax=Niveibacterium sp. 24ML TaxID=2985512 RepID=UPI0022708DC1|nr:DNA internalization-related competence protein ComEC/Rec2 [Niveibacterium sp. 24ML]MCX9158345.1 DNA internalization-related competence protein ComEC/Rec2 [Niveibacterium sp. 24ML]